MWLRAETLAFQFAAKWDGGWWNRGTWKQWKTCTAHRTPDRSEGLQCDDMAQSDLATVRIEYCAECFDMPLAVSVAQDILTEYEDRIEQLILFPSSGGGFDVKVNGRFAFSRAGAGRSALEGEIVRNVGQSLGAIEADGTAG